MRKSTKRPVRPARSRKAKKQVNYNLENLANVQFEGREPWEVACKVFNAMLGVNIVQCYEDGNEDVFKLLCEIQDELFRICDEQGLELRAC